VIRTPLLLKIPGESPRQVEPLVGLVDLLRRSLRPRAFSRRRDVRRTLPVPDDPRESTGRPGILDRNWSHSPTTAIRTSWPGPFAGPTDGSMSGTDRHRLGAAGIVAGRRVREHRRPGHVRQPAERLAARGDPEAGAAAWPGRCGPHAADPVRPSHIIFDNADADLTEMKPIIVNEKHRDGRVRAVSSTDEGPDRHARLSQALNQERRRSLSSACGTWVTCEEPPYGLRRQRRRFGFVARPSCRDARAGCPCRIQSRVTAAALPKDRIAE